MIRCESVHLSETHVERCTGTGLVMTDCTNNSTSQTTLRDNNGNGFASLGTSNRNINSNMFSYGNGLSSLVQAGAQSATVNWIGNGGTFIASTTGAATV